MTPAHLHSRTLTCLLICVITIVQSACSSSTSSDNPAEENLSFFSSSNSLNERYGTRTTRDLNPQVEAATRDAIVKSLNNFSFDLHRAVTANDSENGSVESGYSAAVALALTSAATGGTTLSSLTTLLGFDALAEEDVHSALNELALELNSRTNEDLVLRTAPWKFPMAVMS